MKLRYIVILTLVLLSGFMIYNFLSKAETTTNASLSTFLSLHEEFCESNVYSQAALISVLKADERFKPAAGFVGVFEIQMQGISYAVSPEAHGCTTDVLVKSLKSDELLFTYSDINKALTNNGYEVVGKETTKKGDGKDKKEVTLLVRFFISPKGRITSLNYPDGRHDQYYTTLFAKAPVK